MMEKDSKNPKPEFKPQNLSEEINSPAQGAESARHEVKKAMRIRKTSFFDFEDTENARKAREAKKKGDSSAEMEVIRAADPKVKEEIFQMLDQKLTEETEADKAKKASNVAKEELFQMLDAEYKKASSTQVPKVENNLESTMVFSADEQAEILNQAQQNKSKNDQETIAETPAVFDLPQTPEDPEMQTYREVAKIILDSCNALSDSPADQDYNLKFIHELTEYISKHIQDNPQTYGLPFDPMDPKQTKINNFLWNEFPGAFNGDWLKELHNK